MIGLIIRMVIMAIIHPMNDIINMDLKICIRSIGHISKCMLPSVRLTCAFNIHMCVEFRYRKVFVKYIQGVPVLKIHLYIFGFIVKS